MRIPFTTEAFFELFAQYNREIFPVQIIFYLLSIFILYLLVRKKYEASRVISLILGFYWLWMGFVYHILFFSHINPAAYVFGALFSVQGLIFIYAGVYKDMLVFFFRKDIYGIAGWLMIIYALLIYPVIGHFSGHIYPYAPELSAPCPTTIFTFGLLLFTANRFSKWLLAIPLLWSLIGFSAAVSLNVPQDYGLFVSGLLVFVMLLVRDSGSKVQAAIKGV
jgi:hypothetical protein